MNMTDSTWLNRQLRRSRLVYIVGRAVNRALHRGEWGMSRFAMELDVLQGRESPDIDEAWAVVGRQFNRLHDLSRADGFEVAVVMLPCKEQVTGQFAHAQYQSRIRALAEPLGFTVIDPLPALVKAQATNRDLFIPYDRNHPSALGHRLIADAIFSALTAGDMFAARPGPDRVVVTQTDRSAS
jgi:hypothetical protein